jgi:hypothetical protein
MVTVSPSHASRTAGQPAVVGPGGERDAQSQIHACFARFERERLFARTVAGCHLPPHSRQSSGLERLARWIFCRAEYAGASGTDQRGCHQDEQSMFLLHGGAVCTFEPFELR